MIEAKWNKDSLKTRTRVGLPDTDPAAYIGLKSYESVGDRRMVYLVHSSKKLRTQQAVANAGGERGDWVVWSWEELVALQLNLAAEVFPSGVGELVQRSIRAQANKPCFEWGRVGVAFREPLAPIELAVATEKILRTHGGRVAEYLQGIRLFWACRAEGGLQSLPFEYLKSEPSFADLHSLIEQRRRSGTRATNESSAPLWQIGHR